MRKKSFGFTLTELLTVIAIIAILAALLIGSLAFGKSKAQQAQCFNNVRQLGVALSGYVAANNAYPLAINPSWIADLQFELSTAKRHVNAAVYLKQGVWQCPAAHRPVDLPKAAGYESYGYNCYGMSSRSDTNGLGIGGHHVWHDLTHWPAPPVKESEVVAPSDMMALGEGFCGENNLIKEGGSYLWRTYISEGTAETTQRANARHRGRANVVFCDSHAESPKLKFLFSDTSDAALIRWNRDHQPHREKLSL